MLRRSADRRTLLWTLVFTPALLVLHFVRPEWGIYLLPFSAYFALACGVIAHNHNHTPTFVSRKANQVFGNWISIFYGYPTFGWIPTHNLNHHKFVNKAGDATITWRFTNRHILPVAATYFFVSTYYQAEPINTFIRKAREKNPKMFRRILMQYAIWIGANVVVAALAIHLYGGAMGLRVWAFSMGLPAFFSLFTIMLFNYEQHAHTDPFSEHDHSRTFVGRPLNFLLFNNGLHTVHHEHPGMHWSDYPAAHAEIEDQINPVLLESNLWGYFFRQYVLAPFMPRFGSTQLGPGPMNPPDGNLDMTTDEVGLGVEGTNAARV